MTYPVASRRASFGSWLRRVPGVWVMACLAALTALLVAGHALAAGAEAAAPSDVIFIAEIVVLVLVGRLLGELMQRIGQPAVMGQLIAGIILGPSVFGWIWPEGQAALFPKAPAQKSMIDAVGQLGILLLLLLTGMETDLALVRRVRRAAASVSVSGIAIPFSCGLLVGWFLPADMLPKADQRLITALFLGTALSISSVKIVALVVREMGFLRRDIGQIIIASAIIDDTIGWVIIAITFGIAAHGSVDLTSLATSLVGTAAFMVASLTVGRRFVFRLIRWANDNFVSEMPVITAILVIMGAMALTTQAIGVHTVLGAFVAGVLVGESPILTRHIEDELRGLITALFMPVFFGLAGLQADLTILTRPELVVTTLGLILIASIGKFAGAFAGAKIGGLSRPEAFAIASGMNARGSTEVIVASIGLSMGVLTHDLFTMIVAMAVATTLAMPPMLRFALGRLPISPEEKARLDREENETKAFLPNLERLLVAIDGSPTGRFAARLGGLLAGSRGMPTTVLQLSSAHEHEQDHEGDDASEHAVKEAAKVITPRDEDGPRDELEVTTLRQSAPTKEAVADEARKGYDFLVVGLEPAFDIETKAFGHELARVVESFEGPLGVVAARGLHQESPLRSQLNILVPVNGTDVSRRAAEVALTLARAANAPITAVTVSASSSNEAGGRLERSSATRRNEQAILFDVQSLAERYDTRIRTSVRTGGTPAEAILRQARRGNYTLIVLGVSRRPGDELFFGNVAATVLERAGQSVLLVAT